MADLTATGLEWLAGQADRHLGRTVTYRRGADEVSVTASVGRTEFDSIGDDGIVVQSESRDYRIAAEDLVLGGFTVLPQRRDRIIETVGGKTITCEVMSLIGGEEPWRYHDRERGILRIHTRIVSEEDAE